MSGDTESGCIAPGCHNRHRVGKLNRVSYGAFNPLRMLAQVGGILVSRNDDLLGQAVDIQELVTGSGEKWFCQVTGQIQCFR